MKINFQHDGDASVGYIEHEEWSHGFSTQDILPPLDSHVATIFD